MQESDFRLPASYPGGDNTAIFVRAFLPEGRAPRAIVQIAHGMAEHSARYARFAQALTEHGYGAYIADHRGHGQTVTRREDLGHFADDDGWEKVVSDQVSLLSEIESRHPGTPVFLMGHSMGSYVARSAALRVAPDLSGLILSGSSHDSPVAIRAARLVAAAERLRLGKCGKSALLRKLTFESFNKQIDDPRTTCDWLSRDKFEVDKYIADPLCGFESTTQLFWDMFGGMIEVFTQDNLDKLPKQLPIYILAGEHDPLNNKLAAIKKLHKALEAAGLKNITLRVYQEARHELLNETNRDEVTHDLIQWLDERMALAT
ncbi:MAG: alpha/beta hydrolase [Myxococcaceae bacterium]|nr:alpha/beta hydrolase [Myxococcaceae bacterium]